MSAGFLAAAEPRSRAELEFDEARPLKLTRSVYQPEKRVYIYSPAVDGVNNLRVATIEIANVTGLNDAQIEFLTNKIADSIVESVNYDPDENLTHEAKQAARTGAFR